MFHIGLPWTKKEKKKLVDERKRKEKINNKEILLDTNQVFVQRFHPGRTWLLIPSPFFISAILDSPHDRLAKKINLMDRELFFNIEGSLTRSFLRAFSREEDLAKLEPIFRKNQAIRFSLKKFVLLWKLKRTKQMNEEDISTMEPPKKKIVVHSSDLRNVYLFEANTLLKDSISRLTLNDEFFPKPMYPRNPFTNEELTYAQLLSVHRQLRAHGITNWMWEAFFQSRFCLDSFLDTYSSPLKIHSIKAFFLDKSDHLSQSYVADFIESRYVSRKVSNIPFYVKVYDWASIFHSYHPHMVEWRKLSCKYWILLTIYDEVSANSDLDIRREVNYLIRDTVSFNQLLSLWKTAHKL